MNFTQQSHYGTFEKCPVSQMQSYLSLCGRACHFAETPSGFEIIFTSTVGLLDEFRETKSKETNKFGGI